MTTVDIVDDKDLDYSRLDNVQKVLQKYKQQQISRRNFDPELQMQVLKIISKSQESNKSIQIEILLLQLATLFSSAKLSINGFFERETWIEANGFFVKLMDLLFQAMDPEQARKREAATEK
jgi:hypothetical protein